MSTAEKSSPLARIGKHLSWIVGGKSIGAILSLVYLAILTRSLGTEKYGAFSLILAITLITQLILSFNIWQVIVKYGHEHLKTDNIPALGRLIRLCSYVDFGTAIVGTMIIALFLISDFGAALVSRDILYVALCYGAIVMFSICNVPRGILRLNDEYSKIFIADIISPIVKFSGAVLAWIFMPTLSAFLIAWACAEILMAGVFWYFAWQSNKSRFGVFGISGARQSLDENTGMRSMLFATNIGESSLAIMQQLPILLVGAMLGLSEAGLYRLAHQLTHSLSTLSSLLNLSSLSEMANVVVSKGSKELRKLFWQMTAISTALGIAIWAIAFFLGKWIILYMSGEAFLGAYHILLILSGAITVQLMAVNCEPILISTGRTFSLGLIKIVSILSIVGGLLFLIPNYGVMGAASARLFTEMAVLAMLFFAAFVTFRKLSKAK